MKPLFSKLSLSLFLAGVALAVPALTAQEKLPEGHPPIGAGAAESGAGAEEAGSGSAMPGMSGGAGGAEAGSGSSMGMGGAPAMLPSTANAAALEAAMAKKYESPVGKDGKLDLEQVTFQTPKDWTWQAPTSSMRKAQFKLPAADGDKDDAELVIFHFGPQAGSVDENIKRWYSQFEPEGGKPAEEVAKREKAKAGSIDITLLDLPGTMKPSSMHPGAEGSHPNFRLLAAIAETPSGPWFIKATGPAKTMEKNAKAFREFVMSVKAK